MEFWFMMLSHFLASYIHSVIDCCKPDTVLKRGTHGWHCVYPIKIDLLLLNVSQNPDWDDFLEDFAYQLGLRSSQIELINFYVITLSSLNISMDVTPHTGLSFSQADASAINSSLSMHKVHLNPTLVGDYKLLNFTWFKASSVSEAPLASAPIAAEPHKPTPNSMNSASGEGEQKHSNFILNIELGVCANWR